MAVCIQCTKEFTPTSLVNTVCSPVCKKARKNIVRRQEVKNYNCGICGVEFSSARSNRTTCSRVCSVKRWRDTKGKQYWADRYAKDPEKQKIASRKSIQKAKDACYEAYGGYKCACLHCDVINPKFLILDHINNDGAEHRRELGPHGNGGSLYGWIIRNNFPPMFQVLCYNCNCGKNVNGGVCPHKDEQNANS
jgi:hypothetical protein